MEHWLLVIFCSKLYHWIGGYTIDRTENFSWPENFVEDGNEAVYTTLPRHSVIVGLPTGGEVCDLDFIGETYSVGMKDGVLIADGQWLGPDQGQTPSIQFEQGQFVSSVSEDIAIQKKSVRFFTERDTEPTFYSASVNHTASPRIPRFF